jgi:hypothetical protein
MKVGGTWHRGILIINVLTQTAKIHINHKYGENYMDGVKNQRKQMRILITSQKSTERFRNLTLSGSHHIWPGGNQLLSK